MYKFIALINFLYPCDSNYAQINQPGNPAFVRIRSALTGFNLLEPVVDCSQPSVLSVCEQNKQWSFSINTLMTIFGLIQRKKIAVAGCHKQVFFLIQ